MPPPQCPECGRFLARAFVEQIKLEPAPCPTCGADLSLEEEPSAVEVSTEALVADAPVAEPDPVVDDEPPVDDEPAAADDEPPVDDEPAVDELLELPVDVAPEPDDSVRPPDLGEVLDPLAGWDAGTPAAVAAPEPQEQTALVAGAGAGLVVGALLGGSRHRGLGALLGAVLGALLARLRG